jgi:hypothetical protein
LPVFSISSVLTNNDIKRIKALNHWGKRTSKIRNVDC